MKRVLLLEAGEVLPPLLTTHGDYHRWFQRALAGRCELVVLPVYRDVPLPSWRGYDAVMMTGSPLSVTEPAPWMIRAGDYLLEAAEGVPVLGVCFGHQLIGHALGTPVVKSPLGREIGTVEVDLTPAGRADPLFAGAPERLSVQTTHEDVLQALPPGATLLAGNAHRRGSRDQRSGDAQGAALLHRCRQEV